MIQLKYWTFNMGVLKRLAERKELITADDSILVVTGNADRGVDLAWLSTAMEFCRGEQWRVEVLTAGFRNARQVPFTTARQWVNLEPNVPGFSPTPHYLTLAADYAGYRNCGLTITGRLVFPSRWGGVEHQCDYGAMGKDCAIHIQTQSFAENSYRWREALTILAEQFQSRDLPLPTIQVSLGSLGNGVSEGRAVDALLEAEGMGYESVVIQFALKDKEQPGAFLQELRGL